MKTTPLYHVFETRIDGYLRLEFGTPTGDFWREWSTSQDAMQEAGISIYNDAAGRQLVKRQSMVESPKSDVPEPEMPVIRRGFLKEHQFTNAKTLIRSILKYGEAGDFSGTGTGKTYTALAVAKALKKRPFVICPKSVISDWKVACRRMGLAPVSVANYESLRDSRWGRQTYKFYPALLHQAMGVKMRFPDNYWVESLTEMYRVCGITPDQVAYREKWGGVSIEVEKFCRPGWYRWTGVPKDALMIFDEAHRCKSTTSINAKMLIAAKPWPTLLCTATLAAEPREMMASGFVLGLHDLNNWRAWCNQHGCYKGRYGWKTIDAQAEMKRIGEQIIPERACRTLSTEIKDFPATAICARAYDMEGSKEIVAKYEALLEAVKAEGAVKAQGGGKTGAILALEMAYREWLEKFKAKLFLDLAAEYHEKGCAVAIFVNFTSTREKLLRHLEGSVSLHGQQTTAERDASVAAFCSNRAPYLVAQIRAGGVGVSLHDTTGDHPRVTFFSPSYSAYDMQQALGRVHRVTGLGKSWQYIVYVAGTVEEKICEAVNSKISCISALNDGDLMEPDLLKLKEGK